MAEVKQILGLMSGTSLDGIDLAMLATNGEEHIETGIADCVPYKEATRQKLRAVLTQLADCPTSKLRRRADWSASLLQAEALVTQAHIEAVAGFLAANSLTPDIIGFHGQTICHRPEAGFTLQIGDGAALARAVGVSVIGQFRLADMAAGGQGAPLAPLFHAALIGTSEVPVAVVNLGGIANLTWICGAEMLAFDSGPANALLDDWVARHSQQAYDKDGKLAARGRIDKAALAKLMAHSYFTAPPPKSLDRLTFDITALAGLSLPDGAATLTAFSVQSLVAGLSQCVAMPQKIVLCGGGRHNSHMVASLSAAVAGDVIACEALGWHGDFLEAQAFAWLAARSLRGLPLSLPTTTGVAEPVSGGQLFKF